MSVEETKSGPNVGKRRYVIKTIIFVKSIGMIDFT